MKRILSLFACLLMSCVANAQSKQNEQDTDSLLKQYILAKGSDIVSFDSSNIKQFWIDKTIVSKKDSFDIILTPTGQNMNESVPLTIQLINVNESQDCKIEVISDTEDYDLSVLDRENKVISKSSLSEKFIQYTLISSVFHLEDTQNTSFKLVFSSTTEKILSIKKIILSFSKNQNSVFVASPEKINYSKETLSTGAKINGLNDSSFSVTGKQSALFSSKKLLVANNTFSTSVKIKNVGEYPTSVWIGYRIYTKERIELRGNSFPYKTSNKVLNVISAEKGSKTIVVDSYTDWRKGCFLALNAKDDFSDIPNFSFISGRVDSIKQLENGQAEIILDKPLDATLDKGTKLRVHGLNSFYLYTNSAVRLNPGEERVFTAEIQKDESSFEYSSKAFPKGAYYVVPLILSYSIDSSKENTVQISDYTISF